MSEHITHIAVFEDSMRIMKRLPGSFPEAFFRSIESAYDCGLFCSGSRGNHLFAVPILTQTRESWKKGDHSLKTCELIAGSLGWITHRAADLQMKPLFRIIEAENRPGYLSSECQIYQDAETFRQVYSGGKFSSQSPYEMLSPATLDYSMKSHPAASFINAKIVEPLLTHNFMQEMAGLNAFISLAESDYEAFIEKLVSNSQDYSEDLRIYIDAFQNPQPHLFKRFIKDFNFYDPVDPLIRFVREIQAGTESPEIRPEETLASVSFQCQYAQALALSIDFLGFAARYFQEEISESEVIKGLRIN